MADVTWIDDEDAARAPELLSQLQSLEQHPGWKLISRILEEQAQYRLNAMVTSPLKGLDEALEQEYIKGEASQLLTLRGLPTVLIEQLTEAVKEIRDASREPGSGTDDSSRDDADGSSSDGAEIAGI